MTLSAKASSGPVPLVTTAGEDLCRGLGRWDLWGRLGWLEVRRRYRRTVIGPFWSTISLSIFVAALGFVGAGLWNQDTHEYIPFLAAGMVVWLLISALINESGTLFVANSTIFRQSRFDYSILVYATVWRNFVVFLHNLLVYVVSVVALAPDLISPVILLAIPGMALLLVNLGWLALLIGLFCLRFRDLQQLISSLLQIAMFVTPIFWPPESLRGRVGLVFVHFNPLYHLIDIARAPLIDRVPALESYGISALLAVVGWTGTYVFFRRFRRRIAYWS